jgi:hypothetical protein
MNKERLLGFLASFGEIGSDLKKHETERALFVRRKTKGLVKGPARLGGTHFKGTRWTLRHEIGHNVWKGLSAKTRKRLTADLKNKYRFSEGMGIPPEEGFANVYAYHRGGKAGRDYKKYIHEHPVYDRSILAEALVDYRKRHKVAKKVTRKKNA